MNNISTRLFIFILISICLSAILGYFVHNRIVVDLTLLANAPTTLKIYWAGSGEHFSEKRSNKVYLHPKKTSYSLSLANIKHVQKIRIDTSDRRLANVTLKKITISQHGYEPLIFHSKSDFTHFKPGDGIQELSIDKDGIHVKPATNDPQLLLEVPQQDYTPRYLTLLFQYTGLILLIGLVVFLFDLGTAEFNFVPFLIFFVLAIIVAMAGITKNNQHPDEYVHVAAARYYQNNITPPKIGSREIQDSYSAYGFSRLHTREIVYFITAVL